MSTSLIRFVVASALVASLAGASPALAGGPVFGGTTSDSNAIVLGTDAKAKKLKSAVISWSADCKGGGYWADNAELTAAKPQQGFTPDPRELAVSSNGRGRFAGTQIATAFMGDVSAGILVQMSGRMTSKRAKGTLHASVTMLDAQGNVQDSCDSGTIHWSASRAPGRIFGGATSQHEPVVVRLDGAGRKVSDLMFSWYTQQCSNDSAFAFGERFTGFAIKSRRFGDAFSQDYTLDDGSKRTFAYDIAGKVARAAASGSLRATITQTDPSGAQTMSCDSGAISWRALTG